MAFTPKLTYRGRPLVRSNNEIYYGNMADPFVVFMQVLTEKDQGGVKIADKVQVMLLSTDTAKALPACGEAGHQGWPVHRAGHRLYLAGPCPA